MQGDHVIIAVDANVGLEDSDDKKDSEVSHLGNIWRSVMEGSEASGIFSSEKMGVSRSKARSRLGFLLCLMLCIQSTMPLKIDRYLSTDECACLYIKSVQILSTLVVSLYSHHLHIDNMYFFT